MEDLIYWDFHAHHLPNKPSEGRIFSIYEETDPFTTPFTIGLHPWKINGNSFLKDWKNYLNHPLLLGIGECGLDSTIEIPINIQEEILLEHIQISEEKRKPLILHVVKRHQEILKLHKEVNPQQTWVVHGFNNRISIAQQYLNKGIGISLGYHLFRNNLDRFKVLLDLIPNHLLFVESDMENVEMKSFYAEIAGLKAMSVVNLQKLIQNNIERISGVKL